MEQFFLYVFFVVNGNVFMDPNYPPLEQQRLSTCFSRAIAADTMFENRLPDGVMWQVGCTQVSSNETLGGNLQIIYDNLVAEVEGERL